jgi:hypothetical protein
MATLTLEYNARNLKAQKTIEYILSLGTFRIKPAGTHTKSSSLLDKAIKEIETGKTVYCENFEDYLQKVGYAKH